MNYSCQPAAKKLSILRPILWAVLCLFVGTLPVKAGIRVVAWGAGTKVDTNSVNQYGQSIVPTNLTNAVCVAAGWLHSLAIKSDGTVTGWGDDYFGQYDFTTGVTNDYVAITATNDYVAIAASNLHSLALHANGAVEATGVGYNVNDLSYVPQNVSNAVAIACGFYHNLALKADGTVLAWGTGTNINTVGTYPNYGQALAPADLTNVVAIAAGGLHSLALEASGSVRTWGDNTAGESVIPAAATNVVAIAAGSEHNLVLKANGTVIAWGANEYGQTNLPAGLTNIIAIAAGGWHSLALKSDGTVIAWGAGSGTNSNIDVGQNKVPTGLTNVLEIAAGDLNSLVVIDSTLPLTQNVLDTPHYGTNGFALSLNTRAGRVYRLEYKTALSDFAWTPLPLSAGTGGILGLNDTNRATQKFYRVRQW